MTYLTEVQKRVLDKVSPFAPTPDVLKMNERATTEWQECARCHPTGIEAYGLQDILALRRKLFHLYRHNTFVRRKAGQRASGRVGVAARNISRPIL